jgi:hypothetical protein
MLGPTLTQFLVQHLWFYIIGASIVAAGFVGAVLYIRKQGQ